MVKCIAFIFLLLYMKCFSLMLTKSVIIEGIVMNNHTDKGFEIYNKNSSIKEMINFNLKLKTKKLYNNSKVITRNITLNNSTTITISKKQENLESNNIYNNLDLLQVKGYSSLLYNHSLYIFGGCSYSKKFNQTLTSTSFSNDLYKYSFK